MALVAVRDVVARTEDVLDRRLQPWAWPLIRVAAGLVMIPHGLPKLFGSFAPVLAANVLGPLGVPAPLFWAYFLGVLEIVGGLLLAIGLATRLVALAFLVETTIIFLFVSLPKGWIYSVPGGGAEYPALLMVVFAALLFGGDRTWSAGTVIWHPKRR